MPMGREPRLGAKGSDENVVGGVAEEVTANPQLGQNSLSAFISAPHFLQNGNFTRLSFY